MNHTAPDRALTTAEFVVLARLSQPANAKPPTQAELTETLGKLQVSGTASQPIFSLVERGLITVAPKKPGARAERFALAEAGERLLKDILGLSRTPTWSQILWSYLPSLELGFTPGSERARNALRNSDTLSVAILRTQLQVPNVSTRTELFDELIRDALEMPAGPISMTTIRAHVFARRAKLAGVEMRTRATVAKDLDRTFREIAAAFVQATKADKARLIPRLSSKGLYKVKHVYRADPLRGPEPAALPDSKALLAAIQDALPHIDAQGRHGPEKVFVSVLWHSIEHDGRLHALSLDRFKRWLVDANRQRLLNLARADLVWAMDPKLVAESEITDSGATFHFVLDSKPRPMEAR